MALCCLAEARTFRARCVPILPLGAGLRSREISVVRLLSFTGPGRCLPLGELPHVPFKDSGAAIPHLPRHLSVIHLVLLWVSQVFIMHRAIFLRHVVFFFLACVVNACAV